MEKIGDYLIGIVTAEYAAAALAYIMTKQYAQATILIGYVVANTGLLWTLQHGR
jgi:hypothetical protein